MKLDYTHNCIILDASGSMNAIREDVVGSVKNFVQGQKRKKSEDETILLDVYQFSGETQHIVSSASIDLFDPSNYNCSGCTALYDAICIAVDELLEKFKGLKERDRPEDVSLVIVTDGMENASRRFQRYDVQTRIEAVKEMGWTVLYLAANVDVHKTGRDIGLSDAQDRVSFNTADVKEKLCCMLDYNMERVRESRKMRRKEK